MENEIKLQSTRRILQNQSSAIKKEKQRLEQIIDEAKAKIKTLETEATVLMEARKMLVRIQVGAL